MDIPSYGEVRKTTWDGHDEMMECVTSDSMNRREFVVFLNELRKPGDVIYDEFPFESEFVEENAVFDEVFKLILVVRPGIVICYKKIKFII